MSVPTIRENSSRAVGLSAYFKDLSAERMLRSTGTRFHLYADFARFYGSIYTHSIAWALHGQDEARADEKTMLLTGNQIDRLVRNTQDRQSMGIPVGPDSSLVMAEIIGAAIDQKLPEVQGWLAESDMSMISIYIFGRGENVSVPSQNCTVPVDCMRLDINDSGRLQ